MTCVYRHTRLRSATDSGHLLSLPYVVNAEPLYVTVPVRETGSSSTAEFAADFVDRHIPVIHRGALHGRWPALANWTDEYLRQKAGFLRLAVETSADQFKGRIFDDAHPVVMPFSEFLRRLDHPDGKSDYFVVETPPALCPDIPPLPIATAFGRLYRRRMLMTRGGNRIAMHWDWHETLLCQIAGRKTIHLCDVTDSENLYPLGQAHGDSGDSGGRGGRDVSSHRNYSPIDVRSPDYTRHPRFARAIVYRADLRPGDILYIPCFWWHTVASHERNIALSMGFYESDEQLVRVHGKWLAGTSTLPPSTRGALQRILDDSRSARAKLLDLRRAVTRYGLGETLGLYTFHRQKMLRGQPIAVDRPVGRAPGGPS